MMIALTCRLLQRTELDRRRPGRLARCKFKHADHALSWALRRGTVRNEVATRARFGWQ